MRSLLFKNILAVVCLSLISLPLTVVNAQSSDIGLSIKMGSATVARGSGVAVFGLVTNNTSSKMRTTVSISAISPCGTETSLGDARVSLEAGKSVALSVYFPIANDACTGMYAVTIIADSGKAGGKNSTAIAAPSATAFVEVQ